MNRFLNFNCVLASICLMVGCAAKHPTTQQASLQSESLVAFAAGDMPIVISAPHGGAEKVPDVPPRKGDGQSRSPGKFVTGTDGNTDLFAIALRDAIERKTGHRPYLAIAKFKRVYIDANRPPELAYEVPAAKPYYDAYHSHLRDHVRAVRNQFGRGLLIDVHGQASKANTVFRGTKDGMTVAALIKTFGIEAHNGPKSLMGLMNAHGMTVKPLNGEKETGGFTGGYIVQHYGSQNADGIDAIQLEHGADYRNKEKIADAADKLSDAIIDYYKLYLPQVGKSK